KQAVRCGAAGGAGRLIPFLRAAGLLWPEYPPFSGEMERLAHDHSLVVFAHVGDWNLGQCLFDDAEAVASWRPHWIERWKHRENPEIAQRIRSFYTKAVEDS